MKNKEKLASCVIPSKACKYLEKIGWVRKEKSHYEDAVVFWKRDDEGHIREFILPKDREDEFFVDTILLSVRRMSEVEHKNEIDLLNSLCNPSMDCLQYRIISKDCDEGMLDLSKIDALFKSFLSIIKASIKDVCDPNTYHQRLRGSEITDLINAAKFGQTERGSYIFNIFIPTAPDTDQKSFDEMAPDTFRKFLVHLMESLSKTIEMIHNVEFDKFEIENKANPFISGNLLSAIADADLWDDTSAELSVQWSPLLDIPDTVPSKVCIKKDDFTSMKSLAQRFFPTEQKKTGDYSGYVTELSGDKVSDKGVVYGSANIKILNLESKRNT